MFEPGTSMTALVDKTIFNLGEPIDISFTCLPAYTGQGWLNVEFLPIEQSAGYRGIVVENADVTPNSKHSFVQRAEFTAFQRYTRTWTIRVQDATPHELSGAARFDLVWIEGKGAYYPPLSDEAREAYGRLDARPAYLFMQWLPEPKRIIN
jgi:hypothetical protein